MIPILYEAGETVFTTNGLGRLSDAISCTVTEERNGKYELELVYPLNGRHYSDLTNDRIILCRHDESDDTQPFVIYGHDAPINGRVTFFAHHISYNLSAVVVRPFYASSVAQAFDAFQTNAMTTNRFSYWTDNVTGGTMDVKTPVTVRSALGGTEGSILDVFGGEFEFDRFLVRNYAHRGRDNGVVIRYGKNLTDLTHHLERMLPYNAVVPFWANTDGDCVYGSVVYGAAGITEAAYWTDENGARITDESETGIELGYTRDAVNVLDLSHAFDAEPTAAQLESAAASWLASNRPWLPSENLTVDFVALWQTDEYKSVAPLERVRLCDTVRIVYEELGVEMSAKVIRVDWDVLADRYTEIELGQARSTFAETIAKPIEKQIDELPTVSMMEDAIDAATALITGGVGGNVVIRQDEAGRPHEILVMDDPDAETAQKVLRININGIGFSTTGVNGPFRTAWTLRGEFNADFISAGTLSANRIQGGILKLGGYENGNGVLQVLNAAGEVIGKWDNTGADITGALTLLYKSMRTRIASLDYNPSSASVGSNRVYKVNGLQIVDGENEIDLIPDSHNDSGFWGYTPGGSVIRTHRYDNEPPLFQMTYGGENKQTYEALHKRRGGFIQRIIDSDADHRYLLNFFCNDGTWPNESYLSVYRTGIGFSQPGTGRPRAEFGMFPDRFAMAGQVAVTEQTFRQYEMYLTYDRFRVNLKNVAFESVSSRRYKHSIKPLEDKTLDPDRLLTLPVKQYQYNDDVPLQYTDMEGQTLPGFIAEDVAEIYPAAAIHDPDGQVESWDERRIIPGMLALIQKQQKQIDDLEARVAALEAKHADT